VGIYDRDYYRQARRTGPFSYAPRTVVGAIIAVNVAVWLIDGLFLPDLHIRLAVHYNTLSTPWYWWQFLTAGFAHEVGLGHILGNMLVLFFLGRDIEDLYGPKEFLRLYLATLVFANVVWAVANRIVGMPAGVPDMVLYGASGAIAGIVVLYALNFPNRTLLLFFVIPMPAWVLGALVVAWDIVGAMGGGADSHIAYSVHLAGAAFALLYYQRGWNFSRLTAGRFHWPRMPLRRKPRLRVHQPDEELPPDLSQEVDRILEKITQQGEASLTAKERHTLETASREFQRKMTKQR
jgi:membrane associated rhomboid family serine protease